MAPYDPRMLLQVHGGEFKSLRTLLSSSKDNLSKCIIVVS